MYNISIQQLRTWQKCKLCKYVREKERMHAEGVGLTNEINSQKNSTSTFCTVLFICWLCSDMFRPLLLAIVKETYWTCAAYVSNYVLKFDIFLKFTVDIFIAPKLLSFNPSSNESRFGKRYPVSRVHTMNEYAIRTLYMLFSCTENVKL